MKNPLQVLDYENWWKKELNHIKPYTIPSVKEDIIYKMEMQLEDSTNRIFNTRANAQDIITHLHHLIDEQKKEHVFPFTWNLKIHRYSPKKGEKTCTARNHRTSAHGYCTEKNTQLRTVWYL